jgi:hypothetical protein
MPVMDQMHPLRKYAITPRMRLSRHDRFGGILSGCIGSGARWRTAAMGDVRHSMDRGMRMPKKGRETRARRKMANRMSHWNGDDGGTRSKIEGVGG